MRQVLSSIGSLPFRLIIGNGPEISPPGVFPVATIWVKDRWTLAQLAIDPEVGFGEAYADRRLEVHGDLPTAIQSVYDSWPRGRAGKGWYQRLTSKWMERRQANTLSGSRDNIHNHYDLGNDFYKLWLDPQLVYTCAYFPTPSTTLEAAQVAKLDHVCRKLQLRAGERVVEAGCGWGALALHMARHYGVSVQAFNISHQQILHARERAQKEGLSDRVEFIEGDWREISGSFDAFVSVGMLEHVSTSDYPLMSEVIHHSIGDSGRGLLHFIGRSYKADFSRWIRKRIFPGAYAPELGEALEVLRPHRYAALDIENLRPHYALTVEHWLERFEASGEQVQQMYGEWFQRAWRLYLAGSIAGFRTGSLQLFQVTFAGSKSAYAPMTRAFLYSRNEPFK